MASSVLFSDFCAMLERVDGMNRAKKPKPACLAVLLKFMNDIRPKIVAANGEERQFGLFPVARLLLPLYDQRPAFNMKEATLAKHYIKVLNLPSKGEDARLLLNFKVPTTRTGVENAGDFAAVASLVVKDLLRSEPSTMTVGQVNQHLDDLARGGVNEGRALETLVHSLSVFEQKWLIRIIVKKLQFGGMGRTSIFKSIHPDAEKMFDVCSNLKTVCEKLRDPTVRLNEISITLGSACYPMLADTGCLGQLDKFFTSERQVLYVETKLDGERVQIHRLHTGEFKYFSRNGHNNAENFGVTSAVGSLTKRLVPTLSPEANTFILDGEMMAWSVKEKRFLQKGTGRRDVKHMKIDETDFVPCYCAFDVLLYNGQVLTNQPLERRLEVLNTIFTPTTGVIELVERIRIETDEAIRECLNQAIVNQDEGIMLKDPMSVYKPSERKAGWWKLKPEYNDSLMEHLDLIILGGYYGKGSRGGGAFSQFLLGVAEPPLAPGGEPLSFKAISKVGSGYTNDELNLMNRRLATGWSKTRHPSVQAEIADRPDMWIDPSKSLILEVKASEITPSKVYDAKVTLRFPRMMGCRSDLSWKDCLTTLRLEDIRRVSDGKLAARQATSSTVGTKKRKVTSRQVEDCKVASQFAATDTSNIEKESCLLQDKEICVMADSEAKEHLDRLIKKHGGTAVLNPDNKTWLCIAFEGKKNMLRVKNAVRDFANPQVDVVRPDWLEGMLEGKRPPEPEPQDLLHMTQRTRERLQNTHDPHGDSYTWPATKESVQRLLDKWEVKDDDKPSEEERQNLEHVLLGSTRLASIFRPCIAYFDQYQSLRHQDEPAPHFWSLQLAKLEFQFYGGRVVPTFDPDLVHYVVVADNISSARVQELHSFLDGRHMFSLVTASWVTQSRTEGRLLKAEDFRASQDQRPSRAEL